MTNEISSNLLRISSVAAKSEWSKPVYYAKAGRAVLLALALSAPVQAELIDNSDGTIYDTVLNITWLKLANNGVQSPQSNWNDATAWAESLVFAGYSDWRLPSMDLDGDGVQVNCALLNNEEACRDNEMGYMFYQNGIKFNHQGPFVIGYAAYWAAESSGTNASVFNMVFGDQSKTIPKTNRNGTWAVRDGGGAHLNTAPTANAGADQSIRAGDTVSLDGSASFDDNTASGALVYAWSFQSVPSGSTAALVDAGTATPSFIADVAGSYLVELLVTDEQGVVSTPDSAIISSDNQAPTAVATVDFGIAIVGVTSVFDGTGSTDPELDALTYSWAVTAAPLGSTAILVGETTASPTLTTDLEGTYEVTLAVSDFIGAGTPATVEVVATTPVNYAVMQIVSASDMVAALLPSQVTNKGNQTALGNFLKNATKNLQKGKIANAISDLNRALERTDGCALRGSSDGNGQGMDWITDCAAQADVYAALTEAVAALQQ